MKKIVLFFVCAFLALFSTSVSARPYDPLWIDDEYVFKWTGNELLLMKFADMVDEQETVEYDGSIMQKGMPVLPEVTVFSARAWDVDESYSIGESASGTRPAQYISCAPGLYKEVNQILSVSYVSEQDKTAVVYLTFDLTIEKGKMTLVIKKIVYRDGKEESENDILQRVYLTR